MVMRATRSTMDKLYEMRMTAMARAYRDVEDAPGAADMDFDELLAMIVDAEWDARRVNRRMRLLRQACCSTARERSIASTTAAVAGPFSAAQRRKRSPFHSA